MPILFRWGRVNCYLLEAAGGFILVDTGGKGGRSALDCELAKAGCVPGNLRLVIASLLFGLNHALNTYDLPSGYHRLGGVRGWGRLRQVCSLESFARRQAAWSRRGSLTGSWMRSASH